MTNPQPEPLFNWITSQQPGSCLLILLHTFLLFSRSFIALVFAMPLSLPSGQPLLGTVTKPESKYHS